MKEIKNADGSRNWEANILLDNIKRLEQENAELKAYKDVNEDFKTAWEELKAENERLKEEIKYLEEEKKEKIQLLERIIKILYPNASDDELFTVTFNSEYIDKLNNLHQTLQEIKKYIAKICKEECGYVQKKRYPDCDCRFGAILDLITKAEEE